MPIEKKLTGYPSIDKPWLKYYTEEAINAKLPEYVQPVDFIFIDKMPLTPIGKVDYRAFEKKQRNYKEQNHVYRKEHSGLSVYR